MAVTFTYDLTLNPAIFYVRLLIADTDPDNPIFGDDEINAAFTIQSSVYQSSAFYPTGGRLTYSSAPASYLRVAALLLDALAADKSKMSGLVRLLDVQVSPETTAKALRDQAKEYRTVDDESGAFAVIERASTSWSFGDRWYRSLLRGSV